jgi:hypothetical protein
MKFLNYKIGSLTIKERIVQDVKMYFQPLGTWWFWPIVFVVYTVFLYFVM